jgi:hypothetical protein
MPQPQPSSARDPQRTASFRGQAATLHVDLGQSLKTAVRQAAERAGMRPSDWVRSQLAAAVDHLEPEPSDEPKPSGRTSATIADLLGDSRVHQLNLQPEDIEQLDRVAASGGFRTRPAALRFLLRVQGSPEALTALRQLPQTIPVLTESNVSLQLAVRLAQVVGGNPVQGNGLDPALRREIAAHLERASRVIAALQPLLDTRR